jgi:hypothetical protein
MAETVKSSDFTKTEGTPGPHAEVNRELEQCDMDVTLPAWLGGSKVKITTRTRAAMVVICSIATLVLALTGAAVSGIARAAGLTGWPVVAAALATPPVYFTLAYLALAHMLSRQAPAE